MRLEAGGATAGHEFPARPRVDVRGGDDVDVDEAPAEVAVRNNRPGVPRIEEMAAGEVDCHDGAIVPPDRAPTHEARRVRPRHPCRSPRSPGDPEPDASREAPAAEVMRWPRPRIRTDPRPAPRVPVPPATV